MTTGSSSGVVGHLHAEALYDFFVVVLRLQSTQLKELFGNGGEETQFFLSLLGLAWQLTTTHF